MHAGEDVTVVVSTYNRAELLPDLMAALRRQTAESIEIVVVDDGSTDGTGAKLREAADQDPRVRLLRNERNLGPSAGRNLGWRDSDRQFIAFTDDDCRPSPQWIKELRAGARSNITIVQGRTSPDTSYPIDWFDRSISIDRWSGLFETCNLLIPRAILQEIGGFDEDFPIGMGEDTDLGYRALKTGADTVFSPDAEVRHHVWKQTYRGFLAHRRRYARGVYVIRRNPQARELLVWRVAIRRSHLLVWAMFPVAVLSSRMGHRAIAPMFLGVWCLSHTRYHPLLQLPWWKRLAFATLTVFGYVYETMWFATYSARFRTLVL